MICLDTNILVRLVTGDTPEQARSVQAAFSRAEERGEEIRAALPAILETVWVLEKGYGYSREAISLLISALATSENLEIEHLWCVLEASRMYRLRGDFADLLLVAHARLREARCFMSFDKKLRSLEPGFVLLPDDS